MHGPGIMTASRRKAKCVDSFKNCQRNLLTQNLREIEFYVTPKSNSLPNNQFNSNNLLLCQKSMFLRKTIFPDAEFIP